MASELERVAAKFRRELINREAAAARDMVEAYLHAYQGVMERLAETQAEIARLTEVHGKASFAVLFQEERLQSLQQQVARELTTFTEQAGQIITEQQQHAVELATRAARETARLAAGAPPTAYFPWQQLSTSAMQELVGNTARGGPLARLLAQIPAEGGEKVRQELIRGMATGANPRQVARRVKEALEGNLNRALTIARTETLRAHRQAALETYRQNPKTAQGWYWNAFLGPRTCAACFAMHGTWHPLTETMGTHPNCRCTMIPALRSWAEITGDPTIKDTRPKLEKGEDWLRKQPEAFQAKVLGDRGAAAFREGKVELRDFVRTRRSKEWGVTRSTGTYNQAMESARRRRAAREKS